MPSKDFAARRNPVIAGCTATGVLKILALVFMFIDHAGKMLFPQIAEMRMLGRIAFPLYCWCMVVGISYTRSVPKYLGRLMLIGLVSQPIYMVALNHSWNQPNIFLTLLVALCGVWGLKAKKLLSHIWAPILALFAAQLLGCDYGWRGVMLVMLLYGVRGSRAGIACVMIAFCLYWGGSSVGVTHLFGQGCHAADLLRHRRGDFAVAAAANDGNLGAAADAAAHQPAGENAALGRLCPLSAASGGADCAGSGACPAHSHGKPHQRLECVCILILTR